MIYGECGRYPLYIQSQIKVFKYWLRLLDMPSSRLPRKCYNMMLLYDKNGLKKLDNRGQIFSSQSVLVTREIIRKTGLSQDFCNYFFKELKICIYKDGLKGRLCLENIQKAVMSRILFILCECKEVQNKFSTFSMFIS